jgi:signal transducer and activator of transcription 5B
MALWNKLTQISPQIIEQIKSNYGENFPIEVRYYLADFLEARLS